MDTQRYCFRLKGLQEPPGQIRALNLQRVLTALVETAARATRLLVTGEGSAKGPRPGWLDATVDFTVLDLKASSTALDIDAPSIGDTAYAEFAQLEFWRERPSLRDTALDCAALAIREAQTEDPEGDYFDSAVLEAILKFRRAAGVPGVRYELTGGENGQPLFTLDDESCARVQERLHKIPAPRAFVVSGRLDEIKHRSGGFRLLTSNGAQLLGRLDSAALDAESLRPLWGRQATVQGRVHFKANGRPRLIEAHRIGPRQSGDEVFEALPGVGAESALEPTRVQDRRASFLRLWGTWPGDEPVDELLDQLD